MQRKAEKPNEQLLSKEWVSVWSSERVAIAEREPTVVREYDYDEEFRHLGYSASVIGSSAAAETELAKIAKRATTVFMCKPGLRDCGANIVASVIVPKVAYLVAFAKARKRQLKRLSQATAACSGVQWE